MQKDFKLLSISFISKLKTGGNDITKAIITLRSNGGVCKDLIILFVEMYLHHKDQYSRGDVEGFGGSVNIFT